MCDCCATADASLFAAQCTALGMTSMPFHVKFHMLLMCTDILLERLYAGCPG